MLSHLAQPVVFLHTHKQWRTTRHSVKAENATYFMGKVRPDRYSSSIHENEMLSKAPRVTTSKHVEPPVARCPPHATLSSLRAKPKESHLAASETKFLSGSVQRQGRATWGTRALNLTVTLQKISTLATQESSSKPENRV